MSATEGMSFLYQFDWGNRDVNNPGSNILSVTSTAAGDFDKANLTTESLRHVWRSADVLTWQDIIVKAELESRIDTVGILGHNFSETAVVRVQANIANNWVAPPVDYVVPWSDGNLVLCKDFGADYEYYRIRILDPANPCGYVQVGRIVGGRAFTMTNNEDITDDFNVDWDDFADVMKNEGYFRFSNERVKARTLGVKFNKLRTDPPNDGNYKGLLSMSKYIGETRPFLAILDRTDPGFASLWGQLEKMPGFGYTLNRFTSLNLRIAEVF